MRGFVVATSIYKVFESRMRERGLIFLQWVGTSPPAFGPFGIRRNVPVGRVRVWEILSRKQHNKSNSSLLLPTACTARDFECTFLVIVQSNEHQQPARPAKTRHRKGRRPYRRRVTLPQVQESSYYIWMWSLRLPVVLYGLCP